MENNAASNVYFDKAAEQTIIGAMLIDNDCINDVMNKVDPDDFFSEKHREIVSAIFTLYLDHETVNQKNVLREMKTHEIDIPDLAQYLDTLTGMNPSPADALLCCSAVKGNAVLQHLFQLQDSISRLIAEEPDRAYKKLQLVDQICRTVQDHQPMDGFIPVKELIGDVYTDLISRMEGEKPKQGILTGYRDIDEATEGLHPKEVTIIAARPAMGKTSFGLNIALNVARSTHKTVAVFSVESGRDQIVRRLLALEGLVNARHLEFAQLSDEELSRLSLASASLSGMDIRINDDLALSVEEITSQCSVMDDLGLIVIDYLQLMEEMSYGGKKAGKWKKKISKTMKKIKNMAEMLDVPVIVLSRVKRSVEKRYDKRPWLSDLDICGSALEDADVIIGLYREVYYDISCENENGAEAILLKNTHGRCGVFPLCWEKDYLSFVDID